jgi:hypothetical protein
MRRRRMTNRGDLIALGEIAALSSSACGQLTPPAMTESGFFNKPKIAAIRPLTHMADTRNSLRCPLWPNGAVIVSRDEAMF